MFKCTEQVAMTLLPRCLERGDEGAKAYRASYIVLSKSFPPCIHRCHRTYIINLKWIEDAPQERCDEMVCLRAELLCSFCYLLEAGMTVKLMSDPTNHAALDANELALSEALV